MDEDIDRADVIALRGPASVSGTVTVPGDKSISHRALILAALSSGDTVVTGLSAGQDVRATRAALARFGVGFEEHKAGLLVHGGLRHEPDAPLDHANSGTGMRLMAGVCAGQAMFSVLTGDRYLRQRPMDRVATPLIEMGASIDGRAGGRLAPLAIRGGNLRGITYAPPVASAQIKSSVLLAGLTATGPTVVQEPLATRRHTEEMLIDFGAEVEVSGTTVSLRPGPLTTPGRADVPGDPSQAAFWAVAGLIAADVEVAIENLYLGFGRLGFVDALRAMGGDLEVDPATGTILARASHLRPLTLDGSVVPGLIDEIPVLAVAAAVAPGISVVSGAAELRVKESDRIATTVAMLTAFGADATETDDGFVVNGGKPLIGAQVDSHGDHRIAMAAAVCALVAEGPTTISGWDSVATSYPGFAARLTAITGGAVSVRAVP